MELSRNNGGILQKGFMCRRGNPVKEYGDGSAWIRGPLLGEGSYGLVYKATLRCPGCPASIAVKTAKFSGALSNEWQILSALKGCPNVIRCLGYEMTLDYKGGCASNLLLEYASGGSLQDWIQKSVCPENEVRAHTRSILRGLSHIHRLGYVHCDMKPDNVLLVADSENNDTHFTAKISDFGLSKVAGTVPYPTGARKYRSPEAVDCGVQEAPSDVWGLGCIVLEMLVGQESAWRGTKEEVMSRHKISEEAKDFLRCCFVRDPFQRPSADVLLVHSFVVDYRSMLRVASSSSKWRVEDDGYRFEFDFDDWVKN